jgi:fluoride exporter
MSPLLAVGVGLLGGLGAVARFLMDIMITRRAGGTFPFGTLVVNVSGAFVLGVLVGAAVGGDALRLLATGLLGGYTTFSTWMLESERLAGRSRPALLALNVVGSLVLGVLAVWLGRTLAG